MFGRPLIRRKTLLAGSLSVCLIGSLACSQAYAGNAQAESLSLVEAYRLAEQQDAKYQAAKAQRMADQVAPELGRAPLLPQLSASAKLERQDNTYDSFGQQIQAERNPGTYALILNQPLFRPQAWASFKQSQLLAEQAELRFRSATQQLVIRVSEAYFAVLTAQDDLQNLTVQQSTIEEQLAFAKKNFEVGNATITDQQEAQARFDLIASQALAARNALAVARLALQTLIGRPVGDLQGVNPSLAPAGPTPPDAQTWVGMARQQAIEVQLAQLGYEIARRELDKSRYGHLPTLDFTAQMLETEQQVFDAATGRPFDIGVDNTTLGLLLNVPIFSGGATHALVKQQAALLNKSRSDLDFAQRIAEQNAHTAFLNLSTSVAQVKALQTAQQSSALALQANRTGYEVGVRSNIDLLNAQQQLSAIERDLAQAKYRSLLAVLQLQSTVGQLTAEQLQNFIGQSSAP
ncbi:MAG TPA: TolC family outer membrane protein [Limnobacter sp.]|nr:TolC family outer membrane protein [Limnobacter sp.]